MTAGSPNAGKAAAYQSVSLGSLAVSSAGSITATGATAFPGALTIPADDYVVQVRIYVSATGGASNYNGLKFYAVSLNVSNSIVGHTR